MKKTSKTRKFNIRNFKHRKKEILTIGFIAIFVMVMGVTCAFNIQKDIVIRIDHNSLDNAQSVEERVVTASLMNPIKDVLVEANAPLNEDYTVDVDLSKQVKDVDIVTFTQKTKGQVTVDGQVIDYNHSEENVEELLGELGVVYDENDEIIPAKETELTTNVTEIKVVRVDIKEESYQTEIPFETQIEENDEVEKGEETVLTEGVNGVQTAMDRVTYKDGVEVTRENLVTAVILEPTTQVVEVGTKRPSNSYGQLTAGNSTQSPGSDADLIAAIVAHEGGHGYEGALAVITCVMNRVDSGRWGGTDAVSVLTAPGQFSSYLDGYYQQYMGSPLPEVRRAIADCMEGGVRSHPYERFRAYETPGSVCIAGGNWYF